MLELNRPPAIVVQEVSDLDGLAQQIKSEYGQMMAACRAGVEHARRMGELLCQAKDRMAHGQWHGWLESNFGFTDRTAQRWMRLAARWPEIAAKCDSVSDLTVTKALAQLANTSGEPAEDGEESADPPPAAPNAAFEGDDASGDIDGSEIDDGEAQEGAPSGTGRGPVRVDEMPQPDAPADGQEETLSLEPAAEENPVADPTPAATNEASEGDDASDDDGGGDDGGDDDADVGEIDDGEAQEGAPSGVGAIDGPTPTSAAPEEPRTLVLDLSVGSEEVGRALAGGLIDGLGVDLTHEVLEAAGGHVTELEVEQRALESLPEVVGELTDLALIILRDGSWHREGDILCLLRFGIPMAFACQLASARLKKDPRAGQKAGCPPCGEELGGRVHSGQRLVIEALLQELEERHLVKVRRRGEVREVRAVNLNEEQQARLAVYDEPERALTARLLEVLSDGNFHPGPGGDGVHDQLRRKLEEVVGSGAFSGETPRPEWRLLIKMVVDRAVDDGVCKREFTGDDEEGYRLAGTGTEEGAAAV
jgi:hypothetical protein